MAVETLQTLETLLQIITVMVSAIPHHASGIGTFAIWKIDEGEVAGLYHECSVYADLIKRQHNTETCGERLMHATAKTFRE